MEEGHNKGEKEKAAKIERRIKELGTTVKKPLEASGKAGSAEASRKIQIMTRKYERIEKA